MRRWLPAAGALFAGPPRLFLSADGTTFAPVTLPALSPEEYVIGLTAIGDRGFALHVVANRPDGSQSAELFTSVDGSTWSATDGTVTFPTASGVMPDGSLATIGQSSSAAPSVDVLRDGVVSSTDLRGLLTDADGIAPQLNIQAAAVGPTGITVVASISLDPYRQPGDHTVTHDGVTMTVLDNGYSSTFTDDAGASLGGYDGSTNSSTGTITRDPSTGDFKVRNPDGSVRVTFTGLDLEQLRLRATAALPNNGMSSIVLHSDDGTNWSRESLDDLAGFPVANVLRVQSSATNVLITMTKRTSVSGSVPTATTPNTAPAVTTPSGTAPSGTGDTTASPLQTVVLVGTLK